MADLSVAIGALSLNFPVIIASGVWSYDVRLWRGPAVSYVGAVCSKAITHDPRTGNHGIRVWETPCGMLNSVGLQNTGIDDFLNDKLPAVSSCGVPIVANVSVESEKNLASMTEKLEAASDKIAALELNVSCPNVDSGCMSWGVDPDLTSRAVSTVRKIWSGPLWVKMTPQAPDPESVSKSAQDAGADALVAANTWLGMAIDVKAKRPVFSRHVAGLSGPAVFPLALRLLWQIAGAVSIPVVGCGGVSSCEDLLAMIMAGASAVEIGSGLFRDLRLPEKIGKDLSAYMEREGISDLSELVGAARG